MARPMDKGRREVRLGAVAPRFGYQGRCYRRGAIRAKIATRVSNTVANVATGGCGRFASEAGLCSNAMATDGVREGESGCLFDEIQNLVEPIERRYTDVSAGPQRRHDAEALRPKSRLWAAGAGRAQG
jgi:hypothetical protein